MVHDTIFFKVYSHLGVYPLVFSPFGDIGKIHPRRASQGAQIGRKCNFDAMAGPNDGFFFSHVLGPHGTAANGGENEAPPLTTYWGRIPLRVY